MFEFSSPSPPPLVVALPLPPPSTPSTSFGRNLDDFNKFVLNSVAFFLTSFVFLLVLGVVVVVVTQGSLEGISSSETIASSLPKSMADPNDEDMTMIDEQGSLVWIGVSCC